MFKNYFKTAFRNLQKNPGYSFINIFGLAVGLACFILIILFVKHELSYDQFYKNADRIYRIVQKQPGNVYLSTDVFAVTPPPLASALAEEYPEVSTATPIMNRNVLLGTDDQNFWEEGLWAGKDFFDVFSMELIHGNPETALVEPNSIVLTESVAHKIFGDSNPVGKTLLYENQETYTVTGVVPDMPANSSLRYSFVADFPSSEIYYENVWNSSNAHTFFVLTDGVDKSQFQSKLPALLNKYKYSGEDIVSENRDQYIVQPLTDIHLYSDFNFDIASTSDIKYVYLFAAIGFLVLLLACVNYTNLAVARSLKRAREVGMRKAMGALRGQLIGQFLGESVLMAFLSFILALGMVDLLLPYFGNLVERSLQLSIFESELLIPGLLAIVIVVGLLSGSYPAFFMTSLDPMKALTGKKDSQAGRFRIQRLLVVFQYAVSIALVAGSFVVYQQMRFVQQKDLGYNREHVVTIPVRDEALRENYATLREEWLRNSDIIAVTSSNDLPTNIQCRQSIRGWAGSSDDDQLSIYCNNVGYDFLDVFGMDLITGRTFSQEVSTDAEMSCLINETAARALGWTRQEAIGQRLMHNNIERTVVGVVKDFHMHSMHLAIQPLIILLNPDQMRYISIKVRPDNLPRTLASLEQTMEKFTPYPFEYQFLDQRFDQLYKEEQQLGETFGFFTILALLIASLGLFGLAAYAAEQRTKEIGIRKVLGATVSNILGLMSKDFLKLILWGFIIAVPVAWYFMNQWLQNFAYRIEISPVIFLLSGGVAILIAFITVSWQSIKAALVNPVDSLRSG